MKPSETLRAFGDSLYECFDRRADALFELTYAILASGVVPSPVHLSLEAVHRRGWGSLYAAPSKGRIDEEALRKLVAHHPLAEDRAAVYAVYGVNPFFPDRSVSNFWLPEGTEPRIPPQARTRRLELISSYRGPPLSNPLRSL